MSHELRTPLNSIINLPEALLEDFVRSDVYECGACESRFAAEEGDEIDDATPCPGCGAPGLVAAGENIEYCGAPADTVRYLQSTRRAGRHLLGVVDDILNFSKVESGRMELALEDVVLKEIVEDVHDAVRGAAAKNDVRVNFDVSGLRAIRADRLRLVQVLVNLVGNAVKFSNRGGTVEVSARAEGCDSIFEVVDRGIGIPEESLGRIFESFRQVEGGHTRKFGGTGLGLAISKKLVELHGGTIEVESTVGEGSAFRVRLPSQGADQSGSEPASPAVRDHASAVRAPASVPASDGRARRITGQPATANVAT